MAHGLGNFLSDFHIVAGQVDVEGHQRLAGADDRRASRADTIGAKIGVTRRVAPHLHLERFVLPTADVFQVLAFGAGGGLFIQVDRDAKLLADALPQAAGDGHTFRHADTRDGHEGHHIAGADARVLALVLVQVDQLGGFSNRPEGGLFDLLRRADKGQHGAVVIQVGVPVEQADRRHGLDGVLDGLDYFGAAGIGKVGNTFDKGGRHMGDLEGEVKWF